MPFYEYECQSCKFYTEVLQKISDAPLVKCPSCGKSKLKKLVSAPVFRLKGGGWYETDFKSDKENKRNLAVEKDTVSASASDSKPSGEGKGAGDSASADASAGSASAGRDADAKGAATAAPLRSSKGSESKAAESRSHTAKRSVSSSGSRSAATSKSRPAAKSKAKPASARAKKRR